MSRHPEVKWAQRPDKLYITVSLPDAKNAKVNLEPEGIFTFSASAGAENHQYELQLNLFDKVNVEESKINVGVRSIFCVVEKAEKGWWKKFVRADEKTPHYVKVDWDKWADEDDDNGLGDLDLGGMDFSKFAGMEGMGDDAMGDDAMGDDAMGDLDDTDDEEEVSKPSEGEEVSKPAEGKSEKPDEHGEKSEAAPSI